MLPGPARGCMSERKSPQNTVEFLQLGHSILGPYESTIFLPVPDDGDLAEWAEALVSRGYQFEMYEHGQGYVYMCVAPTGDAPGVDELCHLIAVNVEADVLPAVAALVREAHGLVFGRAELPC